MKRYFLLLCCFFRTEANPFYIDANYDECYFPQEIACSSSQDCSPPRLLTGSHSNECKKANPNLGYLVGPAYSEHDVCSCEASSEGRDPSLGPFCKEQNPITCENQCNNGTIDWVRNAITGCDCKGTGHWGWYCERENKLLCEKVDFGK